MKLGSQLVAVLLALGLQWYYYFDEFAARTAGMKYKLNFDALPGQMGPDGVFRRFVMVGGQGVPIGRYSQHQDEAWKFLEWLMSPQQQWQWVRGGGKSGLASIVKDPKFLDASPANRSFALSMSLTKDYWHLPAYPQLLRVYQRYVHQTIAGELPVQEALNLCAREHEKILKAAKGSARLH